MTAHVIVIAKPDPGKAEGAKRYAESVQPLLKAAGVAPKLKGPIVETLAGKSSPATALVLEFPDHAAAKAFFEQEAYQDLIPLRDDSFLHMEIHILAPSA